MADFSQLLAQPPATGNFYAATTGAPSFQSNLLAATDMLKLNPQEMALYQRHIANLTGSGGVDHPNGDRSTIYQSSVERGGKTYNIPTVWDGKILPVDEAIKRVAAEGWDKFPSYKDENQAETRYQQMHSFMDEDTSRFLNSRK
jgi:hypothetical protein